MDMLHDVVQAKPMENFQVLVKFDNGDSAVFDCSKYLSHPYWAKLKDVGFFNQVRVSCGMLTWPNDIDIAPEDVWECAHIVSAVD